MDGSGMRFSPCHQRACGRYSTMTGITEKRVGIPPKKQLSASNLPAIAIRLTFREIPHQFKKTFTTSTSFFGTLFALNLTQFSHHYPFPLS